MGRAHSLCPTLTKILQLSCLFGVTTDYLLKDDAAEPEYTEDDTSPLPRRKALTAAYWLVVVTIFLWYTFGPNGNGQPQYSWFIWAIAGVLYAALVIAVKAFMKKNR